MSPPRPSTNHHLPRKKARPEAQPSPPPRSATGRGAPGVSSLAVHRPPIPSPSPPVPVATAGPSSHPTRLLLAPAGSPAVCLSVCGRLGIRASPFAAPPCLALAPAGGRKGRNRQGESREAERLPLSITSFSGLAVSPILLDCALGSSLLSLPLTPAAALSTSQLPGLSSLPTTFILIPLWAQADRRKTKPITDSQHTHRGHTATCVHADTHTLFLVLFLTMWVGTEHICPLLTTSSTLLISRAQGGQQIQSTADLPAKNPSETQRPGPDSFPGPPPGGSPTASPPSPGSETAFRPDCVD